jgi:predicted phage terminase large subunit-like protein
MKDAWRASPAAMASRLTERTWKWPRHIAYVNERVTAGIIRGGARIIICEPPGHGKSEYISHWTPTWFLDWWPWKRVLLGSYGADLARGFGRSVRDTIEEFAGNLRVRIRSDSKAVDEWMTTAGGGMISRGHNGSFTGKRGHLFLIDDPIKSDKEAFSQTFRDNIWRWWDSTAATRLEPDASVIITHTRWHQDDLIGRLLKDAALGKEQWEVINLPAKAEQNDPLGRKPGETLWPERWPKRLIDAIENNRSPWVWSALFQQRPVAIEGGLFKRQWFKPVSRHLVPIRFTKTVRYWDLAATEKLLGSDPDWTVGLKAGITDHNDVYILDVIRERSGPDDIEKLVEQTARLDGRNVAIRMEQEPGASGKSLISTYARKILNAFDFRGKLASGDKVTRAMPAAACAQRGQVFMVEAGWNADFIEELAAFDKGPHDDQVDGLSGAYEYLTGGAREWTGDDWKKVFDEGDDRTDRSPLELLRRAMRGGDDTTEIEE